MKSFSAILAAAGLAATLALVGVPAMAQQAAPKQGAPAAPAASSQAAAFAGGPVGGQGVPHDEERRRPCSPVPFPASSIRPGTR